MNTKPQPSWWYYHYAIWWINLTNQSWRKCSPVVRAPLGSKPPWKFSLPGSVPTIIVWQWQINLPLFTDCHLWTGFCQSVWFVISWQHSRRSHSICHLSHSLCSCRCQRKQNRHQKWRDLCRPSQNCQNVQPTDRITHHKGYDQFHLQHDIVSIPY